VTRSFHNWLLCARPFLVFPPAIVAILVWTSLSGSVGIGQLLILYVGGFFAWTLMEWVLHRAMHIRSRSEAITRFQDMAHLGHHRHPDDLPHSVVRLSGSVPLAALFYLIILLVFRDLGQALVFHAGLMTGYVWYELVHLAGHARRRIPAFNFLKRYHQLHHHGDPLRTFGVSSPIWDWVFGTLPRR